MKVLKVVSGTVSIMNTLFLTTVVIFQPWSVLSAAILVFMALQIAAAFSQSKIMMTIVSAVYGTVGIISLTDGTTVVEMITLIPAAVFILNTVIVWIVYGVQNRRAVR